jgi:hypothetical protein
MTCPECGLTLCQDGWDIRRDHPFVKFLAEKGLGTPPGGK